MAPVVIVRPDVGLFLLEQGHAGPRRLVGHQRDGLQDWPRADGAVPLHPIADVPITFCERVAGESKLSMKQNVLYLRQLASLYVFKFGVFVIVTVLLTLVALALYILQALLRIVF